MSISFDVNKTKFELFVISFYGNNLYVNQN